ncbi:MAG: hypothetical protein ACTSQI_12485 [Candidatus Helarchaeota archaeon]
MAPYLMTEADEQIYKYKFKKQWSNFGVSSPPTIRYGPSVALVFL